MIQNKPTIDQIYDVIREINDILDNQNKSNSEGVDC